MKDGPQYEFLWDYYGPFTVIIDTDNAECDLDGVRQPVPYTIILTQTEPEQTEVEDPVTGFKVTLPANKSGYLTYKNNGVNVTADFNVYVKAKVGYGFGWIDTDWITVPVAKTINQSNSSAADGGTTPSGEEGGEEGGDETPAESGEGGG